MYELIFVIKRILKIDIYLSFIYLDSKHHNILSLQFNSKQHTHALIPKETLQNERKKYLSNLGKFNFNQYAHTFLVNIAPAAKLRK